MKFISLHHANDDKHKFVVKLTDKSKIYTVYFGAKGYSDYTITKDKDKKRNYIERHNKREDWTASGVLTAGFWSRWILWNKPTLMGSVKDVIEKFHL